MALVQGPIIHYMKVQDKDGNEFDLQYPSTGTLPATAQDLSDAWQAAFGAISTCQIKKVGFRVEYLEDDTTPLEVFGEGEKKMQVTIDLARETLPNPGQSVSANIYLPGPKPEIFLALAGEGATIVDQNNTDVIDYLNLWYAGLGVLPSFTLSDYQTVKDPSVVANWEGKKITRRSKKG